MDINKALSLLADRNGSELFLTVGYPPCLKVNGQLVSIAKAALTSDQAYHIFEKMMGVKRFQEFRETRECNYAIQNPESGRFRISAFFQKSEPGMVIRRIHHHIPEPNELGLPDVFCDLILQERGLILITGPAGAGKTTSMASLVNHRNKMGKGHIITIEDPIEFIHTHNNCIVTQREVGLDTKTYEEGLSNALRQAPDLVVIGEIRSPQVMKHTIEFVQTGHLCIATLHANTAYQALERVIHFFPQEQHEEILMDLSLSLHGIMGQQLIASEDASSVSPSHEILLNTPALADLIKKGKVDEIPDLMERSKESGMQTIDQSIFKLYKSGKISAQQAMQYADSSNNMRLLIKMDGHQGGDDDLELTIASD
ncbi:PilT/PilU family type 4a pilus ATPase [Endozoicomonas elysicola]|uniref:Twitching motility protein PilT n=1 Tax=Endozoicomonas elysicola TaxID=305900 RepID=A0A081K6L5_9GAMM|nr:PilT/PilU family type 4a pilus ATPase [Endozoicomonas elysicola]KEI69791.1 twitching motility protein PilT [Endozoicomonas elysicola]